MRLDSINEMNRRDLLKKAAGTAISASTGGLDKLAGIAGKIATAPAALPQEVNGAVWNLINYGSGGCGYVGNQTLADLAHGVSPTQITTYLRQAFAGKGEHGHDELANIIGVAQSSDLLDEYTGGGYTAQLQNLVSKIGPQGVVKLAVEHGFDQLTTPEAAYASIIHLGEMIPSIAKLFPPKIFELALSTGDARQAVTILHRHGAIDTESAKQEIDDWREWQEEQAARKKNIETFEPTEDDRLADNDMHQPYESRLRSNLQRIMEAVFKGS